jgi:arylsulfatase A-like enzyme
MQRSSAGRPSVLFLCVETLRADELGCYGASENTSPCLDQLAARGLRFERAYSPSSWTLPSAASYLTGLDPWRHGAVSELRDVLTDGCETIAEAAAADGLVTAAFVTNLLLRPQVGFAAGFDTYLVANAANARQVNQAFLDWLSRHRDERFFAYLHYFDPHSPGMAPAAYRNTFVPESQHGLSFEEMDKAVKQSMREHMDTTGQEGPLAFLRGRYRGEIRFLDAQIGELLDHLEQRGVLKNTLVVFTSDHGEEFGEHHWSGHGSQVFEETVRVPLILWGPEVESGVVEHPVAALAAVSRVATVLGLEDLARRLGGWHPPLPLRPQDAKEAPEAIYVATEKGIDLTSEPRRVSLIDHPGRLEPRPLRALVVGHQKAVLRLRELPRPANAEALESALERLELYDLAADPGEQSPRVLRLREAPPALVKRLLDHLAEELRGAEPLATEQMAKSTFDVLRQLGYLEAGAGR